MKDNWNYLKDLWKSVNVLQFWKIIENIWKSLKVFQMSFSFEKYWKHLKDIWKSFKVFQFWKILKLFEIIWKMAANCRYISSIQSNVFHIIRLQLWIATFVILDLHCLASIDRPAVQGRNQVMGWEKRVLARTQARVRCGGAGRKREPILPLERAISPSPLPPPGAHDDARRPCDRSGTRRRRPGETPGFASIFCRRRYYPKSGVEVRRWRRRDRCRRRGQLRKQVVSPAAVRHSVATQRVATECVRSQTREVQCTVSALF